MNLYERTERRLEVAQKFIKDLRKVAVDGNRTKFVNWIDKVQKEIDKI